MHNRTAPTRQCYACGHSQDVADLRPFGHRADGQPVTFVCRPWSEPAPVARPQRNWYPHHALKPQEVRA